MRVEMIGHAALLCETEDTRILMDPWIVGPALFRSWWHIPEVKRDVSELPRVDYVYISHVHHDHFHDPTLERLDRGATVLVPRIYHDLMVCRLKRLGYTRIRELPHLKEVAISPRTRVSCVQMGNDSMLAVADSSASMLNGNDAFQGAHPNVSVPLLRALGQRYWFDIAFLSFGTAGPFPKCYKIDDTPPKIMDPWIKERAMVNHFVLGARTVQAKVMVPFAGGFALLADRLLWMNEAKTTAADALEALKAAVPEIGGLKMNPGDMWHSKDGLQRVHPPVDWSRRLEVIEQMHAAHRARLKQIDVEELRGPDDLYEIFQRRLRENLRRFPLLRRRMNCCVLFDVQGQPGGKWEVDLRRSSGWFRQGDSGEWVIKLTIPSGLLAEVLLDPEGWSTLSGSYKLDLHLRNGGRSKEVLLDRLMYTPSLWWVARTVLAPRFAEFMVRRRAEFSQMLRDKLARTA